jgi:hypothetical protein
MAEKGSFSRFKEWLENNSSRDKQIKRINEDAKRKRQQEQQGK